MVVEFAAFYNSDDINSTPFISSSVIFPNKCSFNVVLAANSKWDNLSVYKNKMQKCAPLRHWQEINNFIALPT